MGILDEAIREHLELKRRRGAEQDELRQLEDEAFGPPERPQKEESGRSGVPTGESLSLDGAREETDRGDTGRPSDGESNEEGPTRLMDWQQEDYGDRAAEREPEDAGERSGEGEPPQPSGSAPPDAVVEQASEVRPDDPGDTAAGQIDPEERAKREEIARQETAHFDVLSDQGTEEPPTETAESGAGPADSGSTPPEESVAGLPTLEEPPSPPPGYRERVPGRTEEPSRDDAERPDTDEAAAHAGAQAQHPAAGDDTAEGPESDADAPGVPRADTEDEPMAGDEGSATEDEGSGAEIFDHTALADELDQALDFEPSSGRKASFFDDESDEYRLPQRPSRRRYAEETSEFDSSDPGETGEMDPGASGDTGEHETGESSELDASEKDRTGEWDSDAGAEESSDPETGEDVLEETPEFLEETPEHDRLWFEQRPPKGFDFND